MLRVMAQEPSFDLDRFVQAQEPVYEAACRELAAGHKATHWMWFIFPQLRGLGHSSMAWRFGLASLQEAEAYARHPVLGPRLQHCVDLMLGQEGHSALAVLGSPDDLKFRSCMTLFARAWPGGDARFVRALKVFFDGEPDERTDLLLAAQAASGQA